MGALAYAAGLAASARLDWPAGPVIVMGPARFAMLTSMLLQLAASGGQR